MSHNIPRRRCALALAIGLALATPVLAQKAAEKPQYGGELNVGNVYYTVSPLSFDMEDWAWKSNQDTGLTYEMLIAADLSKAKSRGGKFDFINDAFLPPEAQRGELAESWKVLQNPWRVEVKLRKGIMFPAKEGVMAAREMVADDVVYTYDRLRKSKKYIATYYDHIDKVEAVDKHTLLFTLNTFNSEWDYRFFWGYYGGVQPREVVEKGAKDWKNANGTGPYMLDNYVQGNSLVFKKNPVYWDSFSIGGQPYKLPFADKITYRVVKDEATMLTQLRTGKVDILESVRWSAVPELKKSAPQLQFNKWLATNSIMIALRTDTKPFDDVRVRRALNMAVNKQEIAKTYWGGNAELLTYPMNPRWDGYFEPLSAMPPEVQELFQYNPAKAKQLLAEAGHPNGFTFKMMISSADVNQDMWAMVAAYLAKVGVTMEIQVVQYPAYLSAQFTKKHPAGYGQNLGGTNPTTALRKSYMTGQAWNPSMYDNKDFNKRLMETYAEPDERVRQVKVRLLTRQILADAPHIFLPSPYVFTAWWPWVKNYGGELRAGAERPGPIHARVWIDQAMKKQMGY